jgi:hypothetical protein
VDHHFDGVSCCVFAQICMAVFLPGTPTTRFSFGTMSGAKTYGEAVKRRWNNALKIAPELLAIGVVAGALLCLGGQTCAFAVRSDNALKQVVFAGAGAAGVLGGVVMATAMTVDTLASGPHDTA